MNISVNCLNRHSKHYSQIFYSVEFPYSFFLCSELISVTIQYLHSYPQKSIPDQLR